MPKRHLNIQERVISIRDFRAMFIKLPGGRSFLFSICHGPIFVKYNKNKLVENKMKLKDMQNKVAIFFIIITFHRPKLCLDEMLCWCKIVIQSFKCLLSISVTYFIKQYHSVNLTLRNTVLGDYSPFFIFTIIPYSY